jgi:hypothetical protein
MKYFRTNWIILSVGMLLLAACSGSGGGGGTPAANTLSITNVNPATVAQEAILIADRTNAMMTAHKNTTENKTIIQICRDVDRDNDCSQLIIMTIDGTTAQKYTMNSIESLSQIVYQDDDFNEGTIYHYLSNGGEITVTRYDANAIAGTFNASLERTDGGTEATNIFINGSFNIDLTL